MTAKNYGPATSGYLDPEGRNFETVVYQAGKPLLDKENNLIQDIEQNAELQIRKRSFPSGWVSDAFLNSSLPGVFNAVVNTANVVQTPTLYAHVNGWLLTVANTANNTGLNNIDLGEAPEGEGAKRTDLVILEVWRRLIPAGPATTGKSAGGRIWRNGNVKIASDDDMTLNFADDILDEDVGAETTKRVQIQYRLRVIQDVDLFTYPWGITDPTVVANSVPSSAAAPDGTATEYTYSNQSSNGDSGLWRAGNGNPANDLGTVDGYMYALPLLAVFRRNSDPFDRNTNQNGGVAFGNASDRPDGYHYDIIQARDVLDLRTGISPTGWDLTEILQKNTNFLFDNVIQNEIGSTTNGGGLHGHTVLWADEIGVSNANGGNGVTTGDTPGATFIGEFDAVRRSFSDRCILETVVVRYLPDSPGVSPGGATWTVGTTISISPSALPIYPYAAFDWAAFAPDGVSIVDIPKIVFAGDSSGQVSFATNRFTIQGLGGSPQGTITLTIRSLTDGTNTATDEPLFVTLLVAYPSGVGLSKTPSGVLASVGSYESGVIVNNPSQLPAGSPIFFNTLQSPVINPANREVTLTYQTVDHTYTYRGGGGSGNNVIHMPERVDESDTIAIEIDGSPYGGSIAVSDDGYTLTLAGGAITSGDEVIVTYKAIRPLPQNDEQVTVYYEARLPQTVREALLPTNLTLIPKYVYPHMFTLTAGSGSAGQAYPFPYQYVQVGGVYPTSGGTFSGDHELDGDLRVSITTLFSDTGFMQLPVHIPVVPAPDEFTLNRDPGDSDIEGRTYYKSIASAYKPLSVAQTLSDPKKHKNVLPMVCELPADTPFGLKGELVLVLLSRWAEFDDSNSISFVTNLAVNSTTASVYRLKGNLLNNRRV